MTAHRKLPRLLRGALVLLTVALLAWAIAAYVMMPDWWKHREHKHPALSDAPRVTVTAAGIPGDPLNLLVIGQEGPLVSALLASGWLPADPITLRTSIRIAESSVLHRPYAEAPVSNLFLFGRKEDMAFEKPVGNDPRERHHVRFWRIDPKGSERLAWFAAATYDHSVGLSHTTGQITHHIAPQVDADRDLLMDDLGKGSAEVRRSYETDFQAKSGHNGGGDPWQSDGRLGIIEFPENNP